MRGYIIIERFGDLNPYNLMDLTNTVYGFNIYRPLIFLYIFKWEGFMKKYIHYGSSEFNKYFCGIYDDQGIGIHTSLFLYNKPYGCLWGSPVNPPNIGWKEWCEDNDFHLEKLDRYFIFTLSDDAKIAEITNDKILSIFKEKFMVKDEWGRDNKLNIAAIYDAGYDAIEVELNTMDIYWTFYGWDCDSIVILNPNVVIEVKDE